MIGDMIQITTARYLALCEKEDKLNRLVDAGVDNWVGYDEAMRDG